jgi:hypothetical protein
MLVTRDKVAGMMKAAPAEPADHGTEGEDGEPTEQGVAAAVAIPEGAGAEEEAGEDEGVGVDDPLQLTVRRVEILLDRRQGHVEARHRHHDERERQAHDAEQGPPAPVHLGILVEQHRCRRPGWIVHHRQPTGCAGPNEWCRSIRRRPG